MINPMKLKRIKNDELKINIAIKFSEQKESLRAHAIRVAEKKRSKNGSKRSNVGKKGTSSFCSSSKPKRINVIPTLPTTDEFGIDPNKTLVIILFSSFNRNSKKIIAWMLKVM